MLEHVPTSFRVVRHVRPKLPCARCERIVQSEAPSRPIARGLAGPGLLAPVLVAKYAVRVSAPKTIFGRSGASCRLTAMPAPTGSTATRSSRLLAGRTVVAPRARNQHGPGAPLRGWRSAGRTGCSPDPTPADSEPPRSTAWSKPARSTLSTPKPTCATCSASSQINPSIASPSSYLGTLVTSSLEPENSAASGGRLRINSSPGSGNAVTAASTINVTICA
jgi:hypothetical protein